MNPNYYGGTGLQVRGTKPKARLADNFEVLPWQTKQKMTQARAAGMSESEIQRNVSMDLFEDFIKRKQPQQQQPQQQPESKAPGWTSWIRELGGMGGAGTGAAIGTALLPGLGTIAGGVIGGGIGGLLGSGAEQTVRDGGIDAGKLLKEGGEEALWGSLPGVFKSGSILKNAPKGAKMAALAGRSGLADDSARLATQAAAKTVSGTDDVSKMGTKGFGKQQGNAFQRAGKSMRQSVVKPKVPVSPRMASNQRKIMDTLHRYGFKGSASRQLNQLDDASRMLSQQVDDALKANPTKININKITADIAKTAKGNLDETPEVAREINRTLREVGKGAKSGSIYDLRQVQKKLGDRLGRAFDKLRPGGSGALTNKEIVDLEVWTKLDDVLRANAGDAKAILADHSTLFDAAHGIAKEAGRTIGLPLVGVSSNSLARGTQATRDAVGRGLIKVGNGLSFAGGDAAKFAKSMGGIGAKDFAKTGVLPRAVMGGFGGGDQGVAPPVDDPYGLGISEDVLMGAIERSGIAPEDMMSLLGLTGAEGQQDPMAQDMGGFESAQAMNGTNDPMMNQMGTTSPGFVIPREAMVQAMMADLQATGGKNMDKLQKFFEFANYDALNQAADSAGESLTADQQKKLSNLGTVEAQLGQMESYVNSGMFPDSNQLSASVGGLFDKTVGRLTDTNKKVFQDQLRSRGIQIIRAMGEVGNLTEAEQNAAIAAIPSPGDTLEGAMQKIQILRDLFSQVKQSTLTFGGYDDTGLDTKSLGGFAL